MALPANSRLLSLPQEIKDQIWGYAYGSIDIALYTGDSPGDIFRWNPYTTCQACRNETPISQSIRGASSASSSQASCDASIGLHTLRRGYLPSSAYNKQLRRLLVCKSMFREVLPIFMSTLTFHIKSGEAVAFFRNTAPRKLKESVANVVFYVHFDHRVNHFLTCMRLFELVPAFRSLRSLKIKYHMRAPSALENLADATYLVLPVLAAPPPFNKPRYVLTNKDAARITQSQQPGLTIETAYVEHKVLFELEVLGTVTTAHSIEEHTAVLRDLFTDRQFTDAAKSLIDSNSSFIKDSVRTAWPPYEYPEDQLKAGFPDQSHFAECQSAMLQVAGQHEKPWFEKLQKRRIAQIYVDQCGMSEEDAEKLLDRQLSSIADGEGLEDLIEALMAAGTDERLMASILGLPLNGDAGQSSL